MNSTDLANYIEDHQIMAEIVTLDVDTPTVEAAASAVNVIPEQIGKSLLFLVEGEPVLVIANGITRVDYKALADYMNVNRRRIKLANPEQVYYYTGYEVGTVPPFGHIRPLSTLLEQSVIDQQEIYAGGGEINTLMRISISELRRVTDAPSLILKKPEA
ncbi:MAG TPA: YbaK/EbsC family protein [candidate division Zixibacteria bacterium]|nr:YbaK/EbsC family protein [candidate division Zixibacteria bacterium]